MSTERLPGAPPARPGFATYAYLGFIVVCWGINWPVMKIVLADVGPFTFAALRIVGAIAMAALILLATGERFRPAEGEAVPLAWTGVLQIGCLFSLNMLGVRYVLPGRASVLAYTMPLWAILFGIWLARERPDRQKLLGALVGFVGLAVFFDPRLVDWGNGQVLLGNGMLLLSALLWALGAVLYRRRHWRSGFWSQILCQLLGAAPPVLLLALLIEGGRGVRWTPTLLAALAYSWLFGTGLTYWCWAKVLTEVPVATAGQVTMLVPVIAFLCSVAFFGEQVTAQVLLSVGLILLGVVLILRAPRGQGR